MVIAKNFCFLFTDYLSNKWQELKKKPNTMMPFVIKLPQILLFVVNIWMLYSGKIPITALNQCKHPLIAS